MHEKHFPLLLYFLDFEVTASVRNKSEWNKTEDNGGSKVLICRDLRGRGKEVKKRASQRTG